MRRNCTTSPRRSTKLCAEPGHARGLHPRRRWTCSAGEARRSRRRGTPARGRWKSRTEGRVIHYHGGPITPETCAYRAWRGGTRSCRSPTRTRSGSPPRSARRSRSTTGRSRSGAGRETDWQGYYEWCGEWLAHPACDWAVIPDVIGGTEDENDALLGEWPFGHRGVPVWHLNESPERLVRLAGEWPRVALGSAAEWDVSVPSKCLERLYDVLPADLPPGRPAGRQASRPADAEPARSSPPCRSRRPTPRTWPATSASTGTGRAGSTRPPPRRPGPWC